LQFGPEYINPKPFDPRVLIWVSAAVAEAAMRTGVAQVQIDPATYRDELARRLGRTYGVMQNLRHRAQAAPKRIVFSEGEHDKVLRASHQIVEERIAYPILLGRPAVIENRLTELGFEDMRPEVIDPAKSPRFEAYVQEFYRLRRRGGVTLSLAREQMMNPNYFGAMMVHMGDADGFVAGVSQNYP
jgi:malate dehydrogenase (oxaloacetate-decarboxylating)(NADP+)